MSLIGAIQQQRRHDAGGTPQGVAYDLGDFSSKVDGAYRWIELQTAADGYSGVGYVQVQAVGSGSGFAQALYDDIVSAGVDRQLWLRVYAESTGTQFGSQSGTNSGSYGAHAVPSTGVNIWYWMRMNDFLAGTSQLRVMCSTPGARADHAYLQPLGSSYVPIGADGEGGAGNTGSGGGNGAGRTDAAADASGVPPVQSLKLSRYDNYNCEAIWSQPISNDTNLRWDVFIDGVLIGDAVSGGNYYPVNSSSPGAVVQVAVCTIDTSNGDYSRPFIVSGPSTHPGSSDIQGAQGSWNDVYA